MCLKTLSLSLIAIAAMALGGCGDDGGNTGGSPTPGVNPGGGQNPPTRPNGNPPANVASPTLMLPTSPPAIAENAASREITLTAAATAAGPDGGQITYIWSVVDVNGGGEHQSRAPEDVGTFANNGRVTAASGAMASIVFTLASDGELNLTAPLTITFAVVATSAAGGTSAPQRSTLTINAGDDPPVITAISPSPRNLSSNAAHSSTLSATVIDEHIPGLIYAWSVSSGGDRGSLSSTTDATPTFDLDGLAPVGRVTISLTVTDSNGAVSAPMTTELNIQEPCFQYHSRSFGRGGGVAINGVCTYDNNFQGGRDSPVTLGRLPGGAAHVFSADLIIGTNDITSRLLASAPSITRGGDGPTLTINAGTTIAFSEPNGALIVNRGSRIIARGTADDPITFTSDEDIMGDLASIVSGQWGGVYIAGFGLDQSCSYVTRSGSIVGPFREFDDEDPFRVGSDTQSFRQIRCNQTDDSLQGDQALFSGGTVENDNSGMLSHVIIKHAGNTAGMADYAALSLRSVGNATTLDNIQVFSAGGVGINIRGGYFSASNLMIYNARANSMNISGGYLGKLDRVLISQADDVGDKCIDVDGGNQNDGRNLFTRVRLNRITCDIGSSGSGIEVSAGGEVAVLNSVLSVARLATSTGACFTLSQGTNRPSLIDFTSSLLSCYGGARDFTDTGVSATTSYVVRPGDPTATSFPALNIMAASGNSDLRPIFSLQQAATIATFLDDRLGRDGNRIPTSLYAPVPPRSDITFLGAISANDNPFAAWTFGLFGTPPVLPIPPVPDAISDASVNPVAMLSATATDPEGGLIAYHWAVVKVSGGGDHQIRMPEEVGSFVNGNVVTGASGVATSIGFMLADEDVLNLTAPLIITFSVRAQNSGGVATTPLTTVLTVHAVDDPPVITAVTPALARIAVLGINNTTISATISDEDLASLTYSWSITSAGNLGTLDDATSVTPIFTISPEITTSGTVEISLMVTDGGGNDSNSATTNITVVLQKDPPTLPTPPPLAAINEDAVNRMVMLSATATDPEDAQITYIWSIAGVAGGGSHLTLAPADAGSLANGGMVIGASGVATGIVFTLAAEDALNLTANFIITFSVRARGSSSVMSEERSIALTVGADNDPPVITSVTPTTTNLGFVGAATSLSAAVTDENVAGLIYVWTVTSGDERGTLTDGTTNTATFTLVDMSVLVDEVTISLTITDDGGAASTPTTTNIAVSLLCANYASGGTTQAGSQVGNNCIYDENFVDYSNPLTQDVSLMSLPQGGAHIFAGALVVGVSDTAANLATGARRIFVGGNGPTLNIAAGATVALMESGDLLIINRGSQIIARGTADAPITFTSDEDVMGDVGSTVAGQWAGITINGFAPVNDCQYSVTADPSATVLRSFRSAVTALVSPFTPPLTTICNQNNLGITDARRSQYGGAHHNDGSGVLEYVVIKHAGGQLGAAVPSALTLNATGQTTTVNNVQIFSTLGDGFTRVGGAGTVSNLLIYNARGNGISIFDGYAGRVFRVIVSQDRISGGRCIHVRGRNLNSALPSSSGLLTRAFIFRLTCDISPTPARTTGIASDAGSGVFVENGASVRIQDSLIVASRFPADTSNANDNYCMRATAGSPGQTTELIFLAAVLSCYDAGDTFDNSLISGTRAQFAFPGDPTTNGDTWLIILASFIAVDNRPLLSFLHSLTTVTQPLRGVGRVPQSQYAPQADMGSATAFLGAIGITGDANPFAWTFGVFQ